MSLPIVSLFFASFVLTGLMIRYLQRKGIHDIPNDRSSHTVPTPRGGGLVLAGLTLVWLIFTALSSPFLSRTWLAALTVAGSSVALIGYLDDLSPISARRRLLVHFFAAAVIALLARKDLFILSHVVLIAIAIVFLVAAINFTNFMDGINGIAGFQLLLTSATAWWVAGEAFDPGLLNLGAALALTSLGFLPWNFPRARIFMGDVGSGFAGLMLGVLVLRGFNHPPAVWGPIVGSVFFFWLDALVTVIRRWMRGAKVTEAHREHLYQRLALRWKSHTPVTLLYAGAEVLLVLAIFYVLS